MALLDPEAAEPPVADSNVVAKMQAEREVARLSNVRQLKPVAQGLRGAPPG